MKKETIKYITGYMHPYIIRFVAVLLIILFTTTIVAFYPLLFGQLIDVLFYNKDVSQFFKIVFIYFVIYTVNQILHYCLDIQVAKLRIDYSFDIKKSLFHKVLTYKSDRLTNLNTGDIVFRINRDAEEALNLIYHDIFYGISALFDFIICFILLSFISLPFAGLSLVLAVTTFIITNAFKKNLKPLYDKVAKQLSAKQNWLLEYLSGMRDIRLMNATQRCIHKYMDQENGIIGTNYSIIKKELIADRINGAVQLLSKLILLTIAAFFITGNILTLGALVACLDYFNRMVLTINRMYKKIISMAKRTVSIDRLIEIEKQECESLSYLDLQAKLKNGDIVFRDVSFSYTKEDKILDKLNLHVCAGERIAIVGKSGQGKSTLAEILCRFYDVDEGELFIDGHNIKSYSLQELRGKIGLVNQTTTIFNATVRYNLVFTNEKTFDQDIWHVLELVEMYEVIQKLPHGLDTELSSSGIGLSGGQRQRLSIARAYLKKPKVLIFDESTSALDGNTEFQIIKKWQELFPETTIIIIAHRLSTIIHCDRIAYLENGNILACDTHSRLMEFCEKYRTLFYEQAAYYAENGEEEYNDQV